MERGFALSAATLLITLSMISNTLTAGEWPPEELAYILGEWELDIPGNRGLNQFEWDGQRAAFLGYATKLGDVGAAVGFKLGEHVATIKQTSNGGLICIMKYRWGQGGVSHGYEWREHELDMQRSSMHVLWLKDEAGDYRYVRTKSSSTR